MGGSRSIRELRQLTLAFPLNAQCRLDNFLVDGNEELVARIRSLAAGPNGFAGCFLWGERGVGKSHLLQAACQHVDADAAGADRGGRGAIYLPLADPEVGPGVLEGLDVLAVVALDDLQCWVGRPDHEQALLGLYQGLVQSGGRLLLGADRYQLDFRYADLASRVRALAAFRVRPLDDTGKGRVLQRLAAERGLELEASVVDFWLMRGPRALPELITQLDVLDRAALAARRRLTVPLLKAALDL